jgi:hypothetical protein
MEIIAGLHTVDRSPYQHVWKIWLTRNDRAPFGQVK